MTFVKLIEDLTLSFGEIQRKNAAYNNFCTKKYSGNDKTEKTFILKKIKSLKVGLTFCQQYFLWVIEISFSLCFLYNFHYLKEDFSKQVKYSTIFQEF